MLSRTPFVLGLLAVSRSVSAQYTIQDSYTASNFFDGFSFYDGTDPTHGYVSFVSSSIANTTALAGLSQDQVYLGVDHTTLNPPNGRASTRLSSTKAYTHGLFLADIGHMPSSTCGVWPAFWTFGPNWPASGEIDIIEGVNAASTNTATLHTSSGCNMENSGSISGSNLAVSNCNSDTGCSQTTTSTQGYGSVFNTGLGGVYALEWTSSHIAVWFFPRSSIPADILADTPDPSTWGDASTRFVGNTCEIDSHFMNHNIVFDTTFCGDWAGQTWSSDATCGKLADACNDYVAQNPEAFKEAYWLINSVKVFGMKATGVAEREWRA